MRSHITGSQGFEVQGSAERDRCTQFPSVTPGSTTDCHGKFKDDEVSGLTFYSQVREALGTVFLTVFGFVFCCAASCFVACGMLMFKEEGVGEPDKAPADLERNAAEPKVVQVCVVSQPVDTNDSNEDNHTNTAAHDI